MRAGRTADGRLGWGGLLHAAELGLAAGIVSAIAAAAAGPASRLATWTPADGGVQLAGAATRVSGPPEDIGGALLDELLPPPFGREPLPAAVAVPTWPGTPVPLPQASPAPSASGTPVAVLPPPRDPLRVVVPATPAPRPPVTVGPGTSIGAPQPFPHAAPTPFPAPLNAALSAVAAQTLADLNASRAHAGLRPLRADAGLSRAALTHAAAIAEQGQMTHTGYIDDVNNQGVSWQGLGEVLGSDPATANAAAVNQAWMQSPEHLSIITDPKFTAAGVGWARYANGSWYVSVILSY